MGAQRIVAGLPRTEKVDCQACGAVKELGLPCEECAFPIIGSWLARNGRPRVCLPLCPSTNVRTRPVRMGRTVREILTDDARDYIATVSAELAKLTPTILSPFVPIETYQTLGLWVCLPRTNCDAHNYGKVLFDTLEKAGVVTNDKFLLPHYRGIWHDAKEPQIIIEL